MVRKEHSPALSRDSAPVVDREPRCWRCRRRTGLKGPAALTATSAAETTLHEETKGARSAASGTRGLLARLLAELSEAPNVDLSWSGFGEDELARLLKSLDAREKRERVEAFNLDAAVQAAQPAIGSGVATCGRSANTGCSAAMRPKASR